MEYLTVLLKPNKESYKPDNATTSLHSEASVFRMSLIFPTNGFDNCLNESHEFKNILSIVM